MARNVARSSRHLMELGVFHDRTHHSDDAPSTGTHTRAVARKIYKTKAHRADRRMERTLVMRALMEEMYFPTAR